MSLKFSELQRDNEKEIRCMVVQGINKKIKVYYDDFDSVGGKLFSKIVTIYEPTDEQRRLITDLIKVENDEINNISAVDFLITLIPEMTDIDFNLDYNNKDDLKKINEILKSPTRLLRKVHAEITEICTEIFDELFEGIKSFANRPPEVQESYYKTFLAEQNNE